ncbi:MAG: chorismate synthase [Candidatus Omnitrophica bacterium]|nr:chorismate synthase [Candidatus Omnitrophota bacterium]
MLRFLSAGESHGKAIISILEGMPAGLRIDLDFINKELRRRQSGFGRGRRMQLEKDQAKIISGIKNNITLGSPIALLIENKDVSIEKLKKILCPRPGHADLAGLLKYRFTDIREVLERASARSTAGLVSIGAVCKLFLREFGMQVSSKVISIGDKYSKGEMLKKISEAIKNKDTLGGIFEVVAKGVVPGLGSYVHPDRRLDAKIAGNVMAIPGIKAVEIGLGFGYAEKFGSQVHDEIYYSKGKGFFRKTNNAGGIEGGISNGEDIIVRACMKPICTLTKPLKSVNIRTLSEAKAAVERSDTCVVEAAGVIAESVVSYVLSDCFLEKFGSDSLRDIKEGFRIYLKRIR